MALFKNKYRIESTRLKGWDYAAAGWYFVTICTRGREHFFGQVVEADVQLTDIGDIGSQYWYDIPKHFPSADVDEFVVMPNHVHGIVVIKHSVETPHVASLPAGNKFGPLKPGSLSKIVQAYKAAVTRWCRQNNHLEFDWQPRFYDHVVRDEKTLKAIRQYIAANPAKWEFDRDKQENVWM